MNIDKLKDSHSFALGCLYSAYIRAHPKNDDLEKTIVTALIGDGVFEIDWVDYDDVAKTVNIAYEGGVNVVEAAQEMIKLCGIKMNLRDILNLPMEPDTNEAEASSVLDYLHKLQSKVWAEQEDFNSKRPWGNGSWTYDLAEVLIANKVISGSLDEDGYVKDYNRIEFNVMVHQLINEVYKSCKK